MATRGRSILTANLRFDTTGECFPEPASVLGSNDRFPYNVIRFGISNVAQPTVRHGFYGAFRVPDNYVGSGVIVPRWTASVTSGNVVWDFDHRNISGDDTESLDQSGESAALTVTDAAPSAAFNQLVAGITLGTIAAGMFIQYGFFRDGADAADTMAAAAILHGLDFVYSDS